MKKQKVFVLIKHGADNQDYSGVNVIRSLLHQDRSQGADGRRGG